MNILELILWILLGALGIWAIVELVKWLQIVG